MNLNLSASANAARLLLSPGLCLPHHTLSTFNDLPIPLGKGLLARGIEADIRAVVLDKDDCFARPDATDVYGPYKVRRPRGACRRALLTRDPAAGAL